MGVRSNSLYQVILSVANMSPGVSGDKYSPQEKGGREGESWREQEKGGEDGVGEQEREEV